MIGKCLVATSCLFVAAFVASLLPLGIYAEAISNKPATEIHIPKIHPDLKHHLRGIEENLPGEREEATIRQHVAALLLLPCFYGLMSRFVAASEAAIKKSGNLPLDAMSGEKILDDSEDSLLLMPGKFADFFENTAGLADGTALSFSFILPPEQMIHRYIQHRR